MHSLAFSSRALLSAPDVQRPVHELWEAVQRHHDVSLRGLQSDCSNLVSVEVGEPERRVFPGGAVGGSAAVACAD